MQSPEVIAEILRLAVAGYSRAAIAEQVGATLSVVNGLLRRRGVGIVPAPPRSKRSVPTGTERHGVRPAAAVEFELDPGRDGVSWEDLAPQACCWPLHGGWWCGAAKAPGSSYCLEHDARAHAYAVEPQRAAARPRFATW